MGSAGLSPARRLPRMQEVPRIIQPGAEMASPEHRKRLTLGTRLQGELRFPFFEGGVRCLITSSRGPARPVRPRGEADEATLHDNQISRDADVHRSYSP